MEELYFSCVNICDVQGFYDDLWLVDDPSHSDCEVNVVHWGADNAYHILLAACLCDELAMH